MIYYPQKSPVTYTNSLLFTDLSSDMYTGPDVDREEVVGKATETATVTNSFCILTNSIASTEVGDDACMRDGSD